MEILTNDLEMNESLKNTFSSVLGKMVEEFFQNPEVQASYEEQKPELTKEILRLERLRKRKEGENGINQGQEN